MIKKTLAAFAIIFLFAFTCFSASPPAFLIIPPFARAAGMAGAFTTLSEGTYGLYYNPAGIPSVMGFESQITWSPWLEGAQYFQLALINPYPLFGTGKIGASIAYIDAGRQAAAGRSHVLDWSSYPQGIDRVDNIQAVFGAGFDFIPQLSAGINLKMTYEYMSDRSKAFDYGLDIGILARFDMPGHMLRMGVVASDRGLELSSSLSGFIPPVKITGGISDSFDFLDSRLLIAADASFSTNNSALFKIGFEYWPVKFLSIRAGYKIAAFNNITFGLGFKLGGAELYYAYEGYDNIGPVHAVSLLYSWGTPPVSIRTESRLISPNGDGICDKAVIMLDIGEVAKVRKLKLNIIDSAGKKADEIQISNKYTKYAEWNGKIKGKPVPDGRYSVELEAEYETNGSSRSRPVELLVDDTPPALTLLREMADNGAMDLPFILEMSASDASGIKSWAIKFSDMQGNDFFVKKGAGMPPQSFEWDGVGDAGKPVENGGRYIYSLTVVDAAGNQATTEKQELLYMPSKKMKKVVMTFSSDALFEQGKAGVKTSAYNALKGVKTELEKYKDAEIVIFGHTDNAEPAGSYETRLKLSKARANAVKYFLENLLGVKKGYIMTQGYGDSLPASTEDTESGRAKNRRVEVIIQSTVFK